MTYQVDSSSIIDVGAKIGTNTKIWHFSHICSGAKIGDNVTIGQNVFVGNNVLIGDNCKIQNNVSLYDNVYLENYVFCGPSVVFTNVYNPRSKIPRKEQYRDTLVKEGATIGANATIICGVTISEFAFIGAGALVNKNVKPYALVVGVPAIQIGWMSEYGEKIDLPLSGFSKSVCLQSGDVYELKYSNLKKVKS